MTPGERVIAELEDSARLKCWVAENLAAQITEAARLIGAALQRGGKVLYCGNGGSAADSQHLAAEMVGRYRRDRPPVPSIALTTDTSILTAVANDYSYEQIFARQVIALLAPGDILVGLSTSGKSPNVIEAVKAARAKGGTTIALLGGDGGPLRALVDLPLVIPSPSSARVQECHITIGHIICGLIEDSLPASCQQR